MSKDNVFQLRLEPGTRDEVDERAAVEGISTSEWIREAIDSYLAMDSKDNSPTIEEIEDMDWDELEDVITDYNLDIEPEEFDLREGFFTRMNNPDDDSEETANLRAAIIEALESGNQDDE